MPWLIRTLLLLGVMVSTGCSLLTVAEKPVHELVLLLPVEGSSTQVLKQQVSIEKHGQEKQFIAVTRFSSQATKLLALLPTGQTFLYLLHDKQGLEEKNEAGIELPSKDILAMIQFTFWPAEAILQGYPSDLGWHLDLMRNKRNLYYQNSLLLEVNIQGEDIAIVHHGDGYKVNIHTFEQEVLP